MTMTYNNNKTGLLLLALILGPFILPLALIVGIIYTIYKAFIYSKNKFLMFVNKKRISKNHKSTTGVEVFSKKETDIHFGRASSN